MDKAMNEQLEDRPFSQACENNKEPIRQVLAQYFDRPGEVLEIGSGTGQHSIYMAQHLPYLMWQPSDVTAQLPVIRAWCDTLEHHVLSHLLPPLALDVNQPWPQQQYDYIFTANTLHIVSWEEVQKILQGVDQHLKHGGRFCVYGPFNYEGKFTSVSNERFEQCLKSRDTASGIRDFEALQVYADRLGWRLLDDIEMPANNRCLVWQKA
jgi:SAM-dependent methyltransferase